MTTTSRAAFLLVSTCILELAQGGAVCPECSPEMLAPKEEKKGFVSSGGGRIANQGNAAGPSDKYTYLTSDKTAGWVDLPKSKFHRFHLYLQLSVAATIPTYTVQPRIMSWGCTDEVLVPSTGITYKVQTCTALVFVYSCGRCYSKGKHELVSKLVAADWKPVECAGYFKIDYDKDSYDHRFSVFYHEFPATSDASKTLKVEIDVETEFIFWGQIHRDTEMCGQQDDEKACTSGRTKDDCYWDDVETECKPKICPVLTGHKPWAVGPGYPQCQKCVHDEDALLNQ